MIIEFVQTEARMWPEKYIIRPTRRTEIAGQTVIIPGIMIEFSMNEFEELTCNIDKLAQDWAIESIAQGAGPDTPAQKKDFVEYAIRAVRETLPRSRDWKNGVIRNYIPFSEKIIAEQRDRVSSLPIEILEERLKEAYAEKGFELKKSRPRSDNNPNKFGGPTQEEPAGTVDLTKEKE